MHHNELIPSLFRTEYSKMVSVLCKTYGLSSIELAEDFVSDSFLKAAETWKLKGVPDQPVSWLYSVSKNNARDFFKRSVNYAQKVAPVLSKEGFTDAEFEIDMSEDNIKDSQLQMLFAVCDPVNPPEAQIALALKILCGFGVEEIANAFLSNKQTINKRLYRAKENLRKHEVKLVMPGPETRSERLQSVLSTLYLLFNEGYYSQTNQNTIRKDFCFEAMRLLHILTENAGTEGPEVNALMALFCFQSSRFKARSGGEGEQILYDEQNIEDWDFELIEQGEYYLNCSATGTSVTKYHLEAMIAYWHARSGIEAENKWEAILQIYNRLLQIDYSPMAALNRTYALAKVKGNNVALKEALKINLDTSQLYHALLAELYESKSLKKKHLQKALELSSSKAEQRILSQRLLNL